MRQPPIIIATITRPRGETGVQTHINAFAAYLRRKGLPWRLITPYSYPKSAVYPVFAMRKIIDKLSGGLSVWWYRYWHGFFLQLALKPLLARQEDCVIYAQCPVSAAAALKARSGVRQKIVLIVHFNISQADEWAEKGRIAFGSKQYQSMRAFEETLLPRLDGLIFVSEFMRLELNRRIPALRTLAQSVIPNFIADPGPAGAAALENKGDLIAIGSLESRKNQTYALDILAELHRSGHPWTLDFYGDGPDRGLLQQKAAALGLTSTVKFHGFRPDASAMLPYYRACLHTAKLENLPLTLIEALAQGKPIFAARQGGVGEIIGPDGIAGRAIPLENPAQAAHIIAEALTDPNWPAMAAVEARRRYQQFFAEETAAAKLIDFLYRQLG